MISPNAGTSSFAGKDCNPNLFVTSYQNDQNHEVEGKYAQDRSAQEGDPDRPQLSGRQGRTMAGFKHSYKGDVADEIFVPLNQLDYSAELSKISAASPDAVFAFLPGGMGVNFVKQFRQAGLADKIVFLCSAFTVDESTLPAPAGCRRRLLRRRQLDAQSRQSRKNKEFVAAYEERNTTRCRPPMRSRPMTPRC